MPVTLSQSHEITSYPLEPRQGVEGLREIVGPVSHHSVLLTQQSEGLQQQVSPEHPTGCCAELALLD